MKPVVLLLLTITFSTYSVCPLGFTPDEACSAAAPACALYTDDNGDGLCDNPEPLAEADDVAPASDTLAASDSADVVETTVEPDTLVIDIPPDTISPVSGDSLSKEASTEPLDTAEPFPPPEETERHPDSSSTAMQEDIASENIDSILTDSLSTIATDDSVVIGASATYTDITASAEVESEVVSCPLKLTPEEACPSDAPRCTFFTDSDNNGFCDNPEETSAEMISGISVISPDTVTKGCPVTPTPQCLSADGAACPHYRGTDGCVNPSGAGTKRTFIVLVVTFFLLLVSSVLNHFLRGRTKKAKKKRKLLHFLVQLTSFLILGFFVQACYCPLGTFQYLLLPGELGFLGGLGIALMALPLFWALFFGRIYCGWVCPFGVLQCFLGKLNIPRPPKLPQKFHRYLVVQKYVLTVVFLIAVFLAGRGLFGRIVPAALFCRIDPFHTIFSFFLVGSFAGGIIMLCAMLFFPRFFCKYFCFYGTVLSLFSRHNYYHETCKESPQELPPWDSKKGNKDNT